MPRIDAHVHVFARESAEFPRVTGDWLPPEREEPVEKLLEQMEAYGIDQAGLIQIGGNEIEQHAYLLHCLKEWPDRFRGIGLIPGDCKNPEDHMDRLAVDTGIIGFRLSEMGGPRDPFSDIDVREFKTWRIWKHAAQRDYVIWLYCRAGDAWQIPWMLEELPHVRVVLNHLGVTPGKGKVRIDDKGRPQIDLARYTTEKHQTWRLTSYENVTVLLSGQYAFSAEDYPYRDIADWAGGLYTRFGPARLMWATDFPWILKNPGYGNLTNILRKNLSNLSDQEYDAIMGGNASRYLRFPAVR